MKYDSLYSGIRSTADIRLSVFPNPVEKMITVEFRNPGSQPCTLEVQDLSGRKLVVTRLSSGKATLDVENYPPGIYILKVSSSTSSFVRKFCKQ